MKIRMMKQFNGFRVLFSVVALVMAFTIVNINSAYGQNSGASSTPEASPEPTPYKKKRNHSDADLEKLRGKITELLTTVEDASDTVTPDNTNSKKRITAAKSKLAAFSLDDLDALRESFDPAEMDDELAVAKEKLAKIKPTMQTAFGRVDSNLWKGAGDKESSSNFSLNSPLPDIEGPDAVCKTLIGMGRAKLDVIIATNAVYVAAKILDIALNRGCNQVVVAGVIVLGAGGVGGGNASLACIVSDGILFAAEQVKDKVASCDVDFTERSVDAAVSRMKTIHDDLASSVTNDNTNTTNILNNADTNKTTITTAVTDAKTFVNDKATINTTTITDKVGAGTVLISGKVDGGTAAILSNDNVNKGLIIANDDTNRNFMVTDAKANKDFLLRTQIEADLSSTDGATFVAMFLTPSSVCSPVLNDKGAAVSGSTQCGYLDFARAIVVQTIANLAGSNTSQANSFLTKGDTYKTSGDYKQAYQNYRLAYKTAAGISTK